MALSYADNVGVWTNPSQGVLQWHPISGELADGDYLFCIIGSSWDDNITNRQILAVEPGDWNRSLQFLGDDVGRTTVHPYRAGWAFWRKWTSADSDLYSTEWDITVDTSDPGGLNPAELTRRMARVRGMVEDPVLWGAGGEAPTSVDGDTTTHYAPLFGGPTDSDLRLTPTVTIGCGVMESTWGVDSGTSERLTLIDFIGSAAGDSAFSIGSGVITWPYVGPASFGGSDATGRVAFRMGSPSVRVSHNLRRGRRLSVS